MRFLLDTSILLPLEDSEHVLEESFANFARLAHENNHQLVYHPASEDDFRRDCNIERRRQNLDRIRQYTRLADRQRCPWNSPYTRPDDAADNELLFALQDDAVHALITEDRGIVNKARERGLVDRVFTIQTAENWLRRLHDTRHVPLPGIEDINLYTLKPQSGHDAFRSLRDSHPGFDEWFSDNAHEGGKAWVAWERPGILGAICIYAREDNETITEDGLRLDGPALKLSPFKISPSVRGRKIGELFVKSAFRYAAANRLENIFLHGDVEKHHLLFAMLEDFGFSPVGNHPDSGGRDAVYLKRHPVSPPADMIEPFEYLRRFFPHFRHDSQVSKFIIPIRSGYHDILLPGYNSPCGRQLSLFPHRNAAGNAIKSAYLCHAQTSRIIRGDVVLFYRSGDERAVTSLGVVEYYNTLQDAGIIAARVKRRSVYSMKEIEEMATKPTKVMLFRLVRHFRQPLPQTWLEANGVLKGVPQRITRISHDAFERLLAEGGKRGFTCS